MPIGRPVRGQWNVSGTPVYQLPESIRNRSGWQPIQPNSPATQPQTGIAIPQGFQAPQNPAVQNPENIAQQMTSPSITLPEIYEPQRAGPSTVPPNTLKMPDAGTPAIDFGWNPSVNWSDFLSLAHNRYQR